MLKLSEAVLCLCLMTAFQPNVFLGSCSSAYATDFGKHLRGAAAICFRFLFALLVFQKYRIFKPFQLPVIPVQRAT